MGLSPPCFQPLDPRVPLKARVFSHIILFPIQIRHIYGISFDSIFSLTILVMESRSWFQISFGFGFIFSLIVDRISPFTSLPRCMFVGIWSEINSWMVKIKQNKNFSFLFHFLYCKGDLNSWSLTHSLVLI